MRLVTERLVLREFVADDWAAVAAYQRDPRYLRWYPWRERSDADVRAFVDMFLEQQREQPRYRWQLAVTLRSDGSLIGNCGLRRKAPGSAVASLGYELAPWHWGLGYATEAAGAMLGWGFDCLGLHRVWARCLADNAASSRVLLKLGMHLEGRLRDNESIDGCWHDTLIYAILENAWRERQDKGDES